MVGYPHLFMGEDCNALTWFSPTGESRLNQTADLLDAKLAGAASNGGFSMVNPVQRFTGHALCDSVEWVNGLSNPVSESYHSNVADHRDGYTPIVSPKLTGSTVTATSAFARTAAATSVDQAALQRRYSAVDRHIRPERFRLPNLHSARAVRAASLPTST